jgi:hypothetical protein
MVVQPQSQPFSHTVFSHTVFGPRTGTPGIGTGMVPVAVEAVHGGVPPLALPPVRADPLIRKVRSGDPCEELTEVIATNRACAVVGFAGNRDHRREGHRPTPASSTDQNHRLVVQVPVAMDLTSPVRRVLPPGPARRGGSESVEPPPDLTTRTRKWLVAGAGSPTVLASTRRQLRCREQRRFRRRAWATSTRLSDHGQRILAPYTWSMVIVISTLRSATMTDRYSSQSGCSPAARR